MAEAGLRCAVVFDDVFFDAIAVAGHAFGFVAKIDSGLLVAADFVFAKKIIGVFVADGDAVAAVAFEEVVFEHAIFNAPTKVEAVFAVVARDAGPDGGALRAAAGMQTEARVCLADAIASL